MDKNDMEWKVEKSLHIKKIYIYISFSNHRVKLKVELELWKIYKCW